VSLSKAQDILFTFLDEAFEVFGGVPAEIVTDNMKTVMDEARTEYSDGKVNIFGFNSSLMIMDFVFIRVLQDAQNKSKGRLL
jgi:hypothetical protein